VPCTVLVHSHDFPFTSGLYTDFGVRYQPSCAISWHKFGTWNFPFCHLN
jgi:hypothetical protein